MIGKTDTRVSGADYDDVRLAGKVGCRLNLVERRAVCEPEGEG